MAKGSIKKNKKFKASQLNKDSTESVESTTNVNTQDKIIEKQDKIIKNFKAKKDFKKKDFKPSKSTEPHFKSTADERPKNDSSDGKTLFVRNVPFNTYQEELEEFFAEHGELEYCLPCVDKETGYSKGTAFVRFKNQDDADSILAQLRTDPLTLDGRRLIIDIALTKTDAAKFQTKTKDRDKRNLYLAKEGLVYAGSPSAEGVSQQDLEKRLNLEHRKRKLLGDITKFVSKNRLCIHNLPQDVTNQKLRKIFLDAVGDKSARITEARVMKNMLATKKLGKSKGFGFVEFDDHAHALQALRKLNNNPTTFSVEARPIVEFSIESKIALNAKERRLKKAQANTDAKVSEKKIEKPQKKSTESNKKSVEPDEPDEESDDDSDVQGDGNLSRSDPEEDEVEVSDEEQSEESENEGNLQHNDDSPESDQSKEQSGDDDNSDDYDEDGEDSDEKELEQSFAGVRTKPLKQGEKIIAPKVNRKIYESYKTLHERKKEMKKQQKVERYKAKNLKNHNKKLVASKIQQKLADEKRFQKDRKIDHLERSYKPTLNKTNDFARSSDTLTESPKKKKTKWFH